MEYKKEHLAHFYKNNNYYIIKTFKPSAYYLQMALSNINIKGNNFGFKNLPNYKIQNIGSNPLELRAKEKTLSKIKYEDYEYKQDLSYLHNICDILTSFKNGFQIIGNIPPMLTHWFVFLWNTKRGNASPHAKREPSPKVMVG